MRRLWLGILALSCSGPVAPLRAGIYETTDAPQGPTVTGEGVEPMPFRQFRDVPKELMSILLDRLPTPPERAKYLKKREALFAKERTGRATEEDLVNLSACLIRLGAFDQAAGVLMPKAGRDCRNFMILANLATANYLAGPGEMARLTRAIDYLDQAFIIWPKEWPGFKPEQLQWYLRAERTFRDLLRARRLELAKPADQRIGLDPLFGPRDNPVRFVGESGSYEPGKLAEAEQAKLPKDAVALVQQLLVWLPTDTRLYWLYGELLNAQGDIPTARAVLDDCVYAQGYNAPDLKEHRQKLNEAVEEARVAAGRIGWLPDTWQIRVVVGLAALVLVALVYFQFRELVRRRQHAAGKR